ncbi:MAG TPA: SET domain-containing protein [Spirochaetota bacterium]|nr:SET domain-containing protein [Spirochaetota bacterium]HOM38505.1 SET domain-containing protein [Spirochaetota bacterium]HPQ49045.1 SET domain-containing protein [Spirochaetota bacterium]
MFAIEKIKEGEIIEVAPVLVIDKKESQFIDKTVLYHYYFDWGKEKIAIALGYGSLYNHSYRPNSYYIKNLDNNEIIFIALKDIEKNEEITINYNGSPNCCDKLWFEMANN